MKGTCVSVLKLFTLEQSTLWKRPISVLACVVSSSLGRHKVPAVREREREGGGVGKGGRGEISEETKTKEKGRKPITKPRA